MTETDCLTALGSAEIFLTALGLASFVSFLIRCMVPPRIAARPAPRVDLPRAEVRKL